MILFDLFRFQAGWLLSNWWWVLPGFLGVLLVIIYLVNVLKKVADKPATDTVKLDRIIEKLGGLDNISEASREGNRLKFLMKELKKCDLVAIKNDGVSGIFVAGKQVKFQFPEAPEELLKRIEEGKKDLAK